MAFFQRNGKFVKALLFAFCETIPNAINVKNAPQCAVDAFDPSRFTAELSLTMH
jgi:hypothetical protein